MTRRRFNWLLLAAALPTAGLAQDSIIFSKPEEKIVERANSFMDLQPERARGVSAPPKPVIGARNAMDFDLLPGATFSQPISPARRQQLQKQADNQANWLLLTPNEIMGLPTTEQLLGLPPKVDPKLSAQERYFQRQQLNQEFARTNGVAPGRLTKPDQEANRQTWADQKQSIWESQNLANAQRLPGADPKNPANAALLAEQERFAASPWQSAARALQLQAQDRQSQQQLEAMERFRALMESPAPELPKPAAATTLSDNKPAANPLFQPIRGEDPFSANARRRDDSIGRPVALNPLPTVTGKTAYQPAPKPKPLTSPPPWVRNDDGKPDGKPKNRVF